VRFRRKASLSHLNGKRPTRNYAKQKESLDTTIKVKMDLEELSQFYQESVNRVEDERDCLEAALHKLSRRSAQHRCSDDLIPALREAAQI
jgi:GTP1/Obg family GTP-binding protein